MNKFFKLLFCLIFVHFTQSANFKLEPKALSTPKVFLPKTKIRIKKHILNPNQFEFEIPIRVLLEEKVAAKNSKWTLQSEKGFIVCYEGDPKKEVITDTQIDISLRNGSFYLKGKKHTQDSIFIKSANSYIHYDGKKYKGGLALIKLDQNVYLVNYVDLEDYVACVLFFESWPGWPAEYNKTFCIVVRTYGIAKLLEERKRRKKRGIIVPYDIKCTNAHQTYKGCPEKFDYFRKIAQDTKGLIIVHEAKPGQKVPILAMFDIACGGVIPSKIEGVHFNTAPYLARAYPCNFCLNYKVAKWTLEIEAKDILDLIRKEFKKIAAIRDIKITRKDAAGMVKEVRIKGKTTWFSLTGKKLSYLVKGLKSNNYTVEKKGSKFIFSGCGFGHCLGFCQWGARQMVEQGWSHKSILEFFFQDTELMEVKPNRLI